MPLGLSTPTQPGKMPDTVQAMKQSTRWQQVMRRVDELPPWLALGSGVAVFFCASLAIATLPLWGFAVGTMGMVGACTWLFLSGKPVVNVTWKPRPVEPAPAQKVVVPATPRESEPNAKQPSPPQPAQTDEPLSMVELPGGEFWMGSPESEPGRYKNELRHRVKVRAFAIGKYPVTQKQYQELMGENRSYHQDKPMEGERAEDRPVENVSWFDAVRFCNRLSEKNGRKPCYRITEPKAGSDAAPQVEWDREADGFRLPTEAEWEYACRAGTETAYSFGDNETKLRKYAWFNWNSNDQTHAVGQKKPNGWDLHDLHGNIWEWCWDWYDIYKVTSDNDKIVTLSDPIGSPSGSVRVLRGGSFNYGPGFLRSANRLRVEPVNRLRNLGFRCVRDSGRQP